MHGIDAKLLVLGVIPTKDISKAIQHRVALTVPSKAWLKEAIRNIPEKMRKTLVTCQNRFWYGSIRYERC